ncbi:hypothetical protein PROFUN_01127 [Planoprotostelium fungivorum]|uniref:PAS domain-containing protein n=1 Tax=Planoprotostelium fungivorum TaxID=1890364 RepID=A0A2P6NCE5_9EUKA|nr:hypothetical protein PROFUN_01127 [Planoprotostelium fungivorum]
MKNERCNATLASVSGGDRPRRGIFLARFRSLESIFRPYKGTDTSSATKTASGKRSHLIDEETRQRGEQRLLDSPYLPASHRRALRVAYEKEDHRDRRDSLFKPILAYRRPPFSFTTGQNQSAQADPLGSEGSPTDSTSTDRDAKRSSNRLLRSSDPKNPAAPPRRESDAPKREGDSSFLRQSKAEDLKLPTLVPQNKKTFVRAIHHTKSSDSPDLGWTPIDQSTVPKRAPPIERPSRYEGVKRTATIETVPPRSRATMKEVRPPSHIGAIGQTPSSDQSRNSTPGQRRSVTPISPEFKSMISPMSPQMKLNTLTSSAEVSTLDTNIQNPAKEETDTALPSASLGATQESPTYTPSNRSVSADAPYNRSTEDAPSPPSGDTPLVPTESPTEPTISTSRRLGIVGISSSAGDLRNLMRKASFESTDEDLPSNRFQPLPSLSSHSEAIIIIDAAGKILRWSPKSETILGWSEDELLEGGVYIEDILPEFKTYREDFEQYGQTDRLLFNDMSYSRLHKDNMANIIFHRNRRVLGLRKNNTEADIDVSIRPVRSPDGITFHITCRESSVSPPHQIATFGTLVSSLGSKRSNVEALRKQVPVRGTSFTSLLAGSLMWIDNGLFRKAAERTVSPTPSPPTPEGLPSIT